MSSTCDDMPRFLNGELPAGEQDAFREHLAGCDACAAQFHETLQLELLAQTALEVDPVLPPAAARRAGAWAGVHWREWKAWGTGLTALAAGLAALLLFPLFGHREGSGAEWLVQEVNRPMEARLTYSVVDARYRRYVPDRGRQDGFSRVAALPLQELSRMEARGDFHGIATAYLLHGAPRQAMAFLERMPPSVDRDCDRAVIALEQSLREQAADTRQAQQKQAHLEEALALLNAVLREVPDHPQGLWNRALVLREMGLPLRAAEDFEAVARLAEPGWSDEARASARGLRDVTQASGREWREAYAAARDLMVDPQARLPLKEAEEHPGIVRLAFYDAVRAAPSSRKVLRLLPLAEALDQQYGGGVLRDTVLRVSERDFTRREPLARRYVQLARKELPASGALLEELRRSGEDDLYLGALVYARAAGLPVDSDALARLAEAQVDPWLQLLAERERAAAEVRAGTWWKAEQRLLAALEACQKQELVYRCLGFERQLADLYLDLHRPADAFRYAWDGWERAKAAREWQYEQEFLQELADIARYQHSSASARAFLEESLARMPESCEQRTHVHRNLALVEWQLFHPESARRSLERALECEQPLGLTGALVLSDLARVSPRPRDEDHLRRALSELRRSGASPGREALLLFIEGQFELTRSRAAGRALLWRAVELAEQQPGDVDARKARAFAYGALISEEGRAARWSEALSLLARELQLEPVPRRCMLAVSVQHERTLVMVRGTAGELKGQYSDTRTGPLQGDASGLVPPHLLAELRGCEHVEVLALPPVHGLTGLLPPEVAWSYRVGRRGPPPPPAPGPARHLVVTGVAAPSALGLETLGVLEPPRVPDPWRVALRGTQATPSRVLEAMADASEVELHAHGMFSAAESDASLVVLAPDTEGRYALTADQVRAHRLTRAPLVLLATCSAARGAPFLHDSFSLPVAFIEAGARLVLASTVDIPDTAGAFFEAVRDLIRGGTPPAVALRDARARWLKERPDEARWLPHVLLFE